jgi:nucleoside-diphosphate-sugar epimerase
MSWWGDALDEPAVARAVDGCEAVVHAAAVYSFDPRRATEVRRTNLRAAELVLRQAVAQGLDPVVHVSSTVALTRYGGSAAPLPLGDIVLPYIQSKIDSERVARELPIRRHRRMRGVRHPSSAVHRHHHRHQSLAGALRAGTGPLRRTAQHTVTGAGCARLSDDDSQPARTERR